ALGCRAAMFAHPRFDPSLLMAPRLGIFPKRKAVAQDFFKGHARGHHRSRGLVDVAVALVAGDHSVLAVEKYEPIRDCFDCGPDPHLSGNINKLAQHSALAVALRAKPAPAAVPEMEEEIRRRWSQ